MAEGMQPGLDVGVVGGGLSGTLLTARLLQRPQALGRVLWWERSPPFARGLAYGTQSPAHLLNVFSQGMSAWGEQPGHLVDWLARQAPDVPRATLRDQFVPRMDYARYLDDSTRALFAAAEADGRLQRLHDEVVDVTQEGAAQQLHGRQGPPRRVQRVALCVGHFAPGLPNLPGQALLRPPHYLPNPWTLAQDGPRAWARGSKATVVTLGAGLSMVDTVLELQRQNFPGQIVAISRHGLWPRSHLTQPSSIALAPPPPPAASTTRGLVAWFRVALAAHQRQGGDWRQVVDALRPHTVALWRGLPPGEQARFLRHAKSLWDAHRHRVAPAVGQTLQRLRHAGRLLHHAGRLVEVQPAKRVDGLVLCWRLAKTPQLWRQEACLLVNCTGTHNGWPRAAEALPQRLLAQGRVCPGPHGQGLALTAAGQVLGPDGRPDPALWAMGPARLGVDFESVAVPELRQQAAALAVALWPEPAGAPAP